MMNIVVSAAVSFMRRVVFRRAASLRAAKAVGVAADSVASTPLPEPIHLRLFKPTRRNVLYYLAVGTALYIIQYFGWVRARVTKEQHASNSRKSRQAALTMKNLLAHEDARLVLLTGEEKQQNALEEEQAAGASKDEGTSPARQASKDETIGGEKPTFDKKPVDAEKLYTILFDDVENEPITSIGIDPEDDNYKRMKALLASRTASKLNEAASRTRASRELPVAKQQTTELMDDEGTYPARDYVDGMKLVKAIKFAKDSVQKFFGKDMVQQDLLKDCEVLSQNVATARKEARSRIFALLRPHVKKWTWATLLMMCSETVLTSFTYAYALGLPYKLTAVLDNSTMSRAAVECLMMLFVYLLMFPVWLFSSSICDDVEAEVQLKLRSAVMSTVLSQDREYFDFHQVGELQERLNRDTELISRMAVAQPKQMAVQITRFIANGVAAFVISPTLTMWAILLPVPLTALISIYALKMTRQQDRKAGRVGDKAASSTIEVFKELSTVRQFGMEGAELNRFIETATWRNQLERCLKVTSMHTRYYMTQTLQYGMLVNMFLGVRLVHLGHITANRLLMCVINLQVLSFCSRTLTDQLPELLLVLEPLDRLATLLSSTPSIEPKPETYMLTGDEQPTQSHGLCPEKFEGLFEFEDVHFAYPTELQKRVLNGISFKVQPGQKVALVGSAGCGKSTCLQLIQRFYDPHQGHIRLDGHPLKEYDLHYLRAHIGVVAQDNILFTASIYDNITYGMGQSGLPEATEEMVKAACDAANATEFIMEFPNRFATMVGDSGGIKLSGGQKQRIAIARAIIRSPPILLLDEATSALDSVNEKAVQTALDKMLKMHNGVALVIAHRLTTIKNCDNIVVIDKGKKVEEGTHGELMQYTVEYEVPDPGSEAALAASAAPAASKGTVIAGFFHNLWDTQMGEKTQGNIGLIKSASLEDLEYGVDALQRSIENTQKELALWEAKANGNDAQTTAGPPSNS